jgi:hypothetical protein
MDSGDRRTNSTAQGNSSPQTTTASTTHAVRQSVRTTSRWTIGGNAACPATAPSDASASARPRKRTNQSATIAVGMTVSEPCPRRRRSAKPTYRSKGSRTRLIQSAASPRRTPATLRATREPSRSISRPTSTIPVAAVSEPKVYSPEISVRDQPVSRSIGPTNTETT